LYAHQKFLVGLWNCINTIIDPTFLNEIRRKSNRLLLPVNIFMSPTVGRRFSSSRTFRQFIGMPYVGPLECTTPRSRYPPSAHRTHTHIGATTNKLWLRKIFNTKTQNTHNPRVKPSGCSSQSRASQATSYLNLNPSEKVSCVRGSAYLFVTPYRAWVSWPKTTLLQPHI